MKILFTGGGTGGHIMPIIAIGRELHRLHTKDDLALYYVGPNDKQNLFLLSQEGFKIHPIASGKMRRYFSLQNIVDAVFKLPFSFLQSFFLLLFLRPQLVFSKGGTGSLPVTFCARLLRIPVFLHESDIVPGISNRITSKWAKKVFISFSKTEHFDLAKTIWVGTPIKKELLEGSELAARELLTITFEKPLLLVWGGSQGADALNDFIVAILNDLLKEYELIHVCGNRNYQKVQTEAQVVMDENLEKYYHLYESLNEIQLKHALKAAQLIVSRAGSASIFEIAAAGKPSILVPLPSAAADHQSKNAYEYAKSGAAIVLEQANLTPNFFIGQIQHILSQPEKLQKIKEAALRFSKPLAAKAIAREILEYLQ